MHPEQDPSSSFRDLLHQRTQFLAHTKRCVPKSGSSGTWLRPAWDATHLPPRVASHAGLNHSGGLTHPKYSCSGWSLWRLLVDLGQHQMPLKSLQNILFQQILLRWHSSRMLSLICPCCTSSYFEQTKDSYYCYMEQTKANYLRQTKEN